MTVAKAPKICAEPKYPSVFEAMEESGPLFFFEIMSLTGSRDGREVAIDLDSIRQKGNLMRDADGRYLLGASKKGVTGLYGRQREDPNAGTGVVG